MPQRVERAQHNPAQNAFAALLHQGFDGAGAALRIPVDQQTSKIERSQGFQFKRGGGEEEIDDVGYAVVSGG